MFNIPYGSLLAAMANNDEERSKFSSARGFRSSYRKLAPTGIFPAHFGLFSTQSSYGIYFRSHNFAIIGFVACVLSVMWTVERNLDTQLKD